MIWIKTEKKSSKCINSFLSFSQFLGSQTQFFEKSKFNQEPYTQLVPFDI